ncbi:MAG: hypothetical protein ACODAQ_01430 [Phycisphaeraceae bacterium]
MRRSARADAIPISLLLVTLLVSPAAAQDGAWGRHERAFVVPAPSEVTIDGRLDDWDRSPASTVKLDVGYIFGNDRGSSATRRAYWFQQQLPRQRRR